MLIDRKKVIKLIMHEMKAAFTRLGQTSYALDVLDNILSQIEEMDDVHTTESADTEEHA